MLQRRTFPRICIALGLPDPQKLLEQAQREAERGETFFEFRLDYLSAPERGTETIAQLAARFPECAVLATCRRRPNHGLFAGTVEDQFHVLDLAIDRGAQAVDVEIETAEGAPERTAEIRKRASLIVSYHNFETTPRIELILKRLTRIPADIYKIVTTPRKPTDAVRVLQAARDCGRTPLILLGMGETGFPTRVLGPAWGSPFTYAAPAIGDGTAPGQASAHQLRHQYRVDKLTKSAKIFGVVADPVSHSISPAVHNRAFQSRRIDAVYLPFLVSALQLGDFFEAATRLRLSGFSVTLPHKQKVMRQLDQVDPLARRIGAVNTVWRKGGKWRGSNTDAAGVTVPLSRHLRLSKASVLIAGSGGAARGAACALADAGAKVAITGRNDVKVRSLARFCAGEAIAPDRLRNRQFDALVHATPLGMAPHEDASYFDGPIPAAIVFDMVYNPLETRLIRCARAEGKTVIPGVEMFIEQAVKQFEIWTGEEPPRAVITKAAFEALEGAA